MTDIVLSDITILDVENPTANVEVITLGIPGIPGPGGATGPQGPPNVLSIGTVITAAIGAPAEASITGTAPAQVLNLTLPQGPEGVAPTFTIGTVMTLTAGSSATVDTVGSDPPNYILNFALPAGNTGPAGPAGPQGDAGDMGPADTATITGAVDLSNVAYTPPRTRVLTLSGNVTFSNTPPQPAAGKAGTLTLVLVQAATGGPYTVNWPAGIIWVGNAPGPTMPTAASNKLIVHLFWDGVEWTGMNAGSRP